MNENKIPTSIKLSAGEMSGTPVLGIEASPMFTPFREVSGAPCDQPVILHLQGQQFVAVFNDENKLCDQMKLANAGEYKTNVLIDLEEFLISVTEAGLRVMYNPYQHNGNMRWTELTPSNQDELTPEQKETRKKRIESEGA